MKRLRFTYVVVMFFLVGCFFFTVTSGAQSQVSLVAKVKKLVAQPDQISKLRFKLPNSNSAVKAVNPTNSQADYDFVAWDADGNEVGRESEIVGPYSKAEINLQQVFPELDFTSLSSIEVQSSVQPQEDEGIIPQALQLPIAFFSQRDPRWKNNQLGSCRNTTIGSAGCAITSIAMAGSSKVSNFNPASLNTYLTNYGGYSGCSVYWAKPANIDGPGGFTYVGAGSVGSAASLKSQIDSRKYLVVRSSRFSPSHYAILIGYYNQGAQLSDFYYLDPWDLQATFRRVNDGFVNSGAATQIYQ